MFSDEWHKGPSCRNDVCIFFSKNISFGCVFHRFEIHNFDLFLEVISSINSMFHYQPHSGFNRHSLFHTGSTDPILENRPIETPGTRNPTHGTGQVAAEIVRDTCFFLKTVSNRLSHLFGCFCWAREVYES